MVHDLLIPLMS